MRSQISLERQVVVLICLRVHNLNNNSQFSNNNNLVVLTHLAVLHNSLPVVSMHLAVDSQFNNNKPNPRVLMRLAHSRNNNRNSNRQGASVHLAHRQLNREDSMLLVVPKPSNRRPNKVHLELLETNQQLQLLQVLMHLVVLAQHQVNIHAMRSAF